MASMSKSLTLLDSMIASLESSLGVAPVKPAKLNTGKPAKPAAAVAPAAAAGKPAVDPTAPAAPAGEHPLSTQTKQRAKC